MTMNQANGNHAGDSAEKTTATKRATKSAADIAELFEIVGSEGEAIRQLNGCVAQLARVQAAKAALGQLSPAEVRAALMYGHEDRLGLIIGARG